MNATAKCLARRTRTGRIGFLLLGTALVGCAGHPQPIGPEGIVGERARVSHVAESARPYVGILRGLEDDTVTLETEPGRLLPIPLSPAARLEISRGTRSNAGRGAVLGALIGGAGLALVGIVGCAGDDLGALDPSPELCAAGGAVLGGGVGALIGLAIGSASHSERWVEVDRTGPGTPGDGGERRPRTR